MNRYEIDKKLSSLYKELDQVEMANELTACILCNTDTKQEASKPYSRRLTITKDS